MMCGLGHDIVDLTLFRPLIVEGPTTPTAFVAATFAPEEIAYCTGTALGDPVAHFAARFAAKEAALKALDGAASLLGLSPAAVPVRDVVVERDARGRPSLRFEGGARHVYEALELRQALLSLTHDGNIASAVVVLSR
jgi:holo-[acyl-carrier protein] synthase